MLGLTVACGVQPALTIIGRLFKHRRALATGLVASGSSAGGVGFPIMFSKLVPLVGFAWALRVGVLASIVSYKIAWCITRTNQNSKQLKSLADLFDLGGFKDARYIYLSLGSFMTNLGLYGPYYYVEPFCTLLDPAASVKVYLLPLINASSLAGRIIGGYVTDSNNN
ncbi:major facilitator superfamily domain-containing protein [Talaromyces proteolyticus]|uniref:Major facilitator superfamily domain-containing protein n=1 Tax=Talaromyces proteolyticus TaxID=1131652 RepID=A0AAD4KS57_9EURO|nr:major facilitator superfamily domain-containing protein [Talaromyces proteolyticus]KAH8697946.1 major facilitator superfamily domain-containing protein [Talaromyces proteolyticus]